MLDLLPDDFSVSSLSKRAVIAPVKHNQWISMAILCTHSHGMWYSYYRIGLGTLRVDILDDRIRGMVLL